MSKVTFKVFVLLSYISSSKYIKEFARCQLVTMDEEDLLEPHQRDRAKESQILIWIYQILDEINTTDYDQYLRDGVVLCRVMEAIKPGSIQGKLSCNNLKEKRSNIERFLRACANYGVPKNVLFKPEDQLYALHIPRVTRCLFALGKRAEDDPNYDGPSIGNEPYEPVGKAGRRRGGLPLGDDIYVAHIKVTNITNMLPIEGKEKQEESKKRISLYNF
ncbi:Muscle-specific protein 20 [Chamberlinius hualienensis]